MKKLSLVEKADVLAERLHRSQTDKAGAPYITHPRAVAAMVEGEERKAAALLHDVCEDTPMTPEGLLREGFPESVVEAVRVLTRAPSEDYFEYIRKVRKNPIARAVKSADLRHNMELKRIKHPDAHDFERIEKYKKAYAILRNH